MDENGRKCAKMSNTLCRLEIDPGRGGTHSADRKSTRDVAEHTLPIGNRPGKWQNTLCRPDIHSLKKSILRAHRGRASGPSEARLPRVIFK